VLGGDRKSLFDIIFEQRWLLKLNYNVNSGDSTVKKKQLQTNLKSIDFPKESFISPQGGVSFLQTHFWERLPFLIYFFSILCVWPFGNYPLNDDWGYAYMVKQWAQQGEFRLFPPASASLAAQVFFSGLIPYLFGFSHLILRIQSIALGFLGLWLLRKLLQFMETPQRYQVSAPLTLYDNR
jgi:hypothetical protein